MPDRLAMSHRIESDRLGACLAAARDAAKDHAVRRWFTLLLSSGDGQVRLGPARRTRTQVKQGQAN